ncbi:MAG: PIG-L family deacetylase [Myxococcaceae bacterium]|nr:PIG-L family deacetylase [Myxococcaceae bacterium]
MSGFVQAVKLRLGVEGRRRPVEALGLAQLGRALLVFAHMDDEINAVGLVHRLHDAGVPTDVIVLTDGAANPWTDARVVGPRSHFECRRDELLASMRLQRLGDVVLPALPDSKLAQHVDEATRVVAQELERRTPGLVITFDSRGINGHADHMAAHRATVKALTATQARAALAMLVPPPPFSWALGAGFRSSTPPTVATLSLSDEEVELKAQVFDAYASQQRTLRLLTGGLAPRAFFGLFRAEWYLWLTAGEAAQWHRQPR